MHSLKRLLRPEAARPPIVFVPVGLSLLAVMGCRSFSPASPGDLPFRERAETKIEEEVRISTAVLTAEEARAVFDAKLYKKKIQPVWLEVANDSGQPLWLLPRSLDPDYFSPLEVAQKTSWMRSGSAKRESRQFFYEQQMPFEIPAGETRSGFVFANLSRGVRWVLVELFGEGAHLEVDFVQEIPGLRADFHALEEGDLYEGLFPGQTILDLDEGTLLQWIESQPATTTNAAGTRDGDPLNLVIIGEAEAVWPAFLSSGWDPTAAMSTGSVLKTGFFGIFGGSYRHSPISSLFVYGRSQDLALQKIRSNIHYRNHLRLWLAPVTFEGLPVMVGQISRDIGSRLTTRSSTFTTHRIDPNVDDTRAALVQDFIHAQSLAGFALAGGVGFVPYEEPRTNLTGDPWFTDGKRAVVLLTREPKSLDEIDWFDWAGAEEEPDR